MSEKAKRFQAKFAVTIVANIVFFAGWLFLLSSIPTKAKEVAKLKNTAVDKQNVGEVAVLQADIDANADKIEEVKGFFVNEDGLLAFSDTVDRLKASGVVTDFSFASDKLVTDKEGNKVFAFSIEFQGSMDSINDAVKTFLGQKYLIKAVESQLVRQTDGQASFVYRGFLYVQEP